MLQKVREQNADLVYQARSIKDSIGVLRNIRFIFYHSDALRVDLVKIFERPKSTLTRCSSGEWLSEVSIVEIEERLKIKERWGATLSAGLAWLYGGDEEYTDDNNLFPSAGVGVTFTIKPEEKMVVRAEYAVGKADNSAFYLRFWQPF
jgi:hypothetical protein